MTVDDSNTAPVEDAAPLLTLVQHQPPDGACFHLVSAHITWSDGARSEGWGRDADLHAARLKAGAEAVERHAWATLPAQARWTAANALSRWIHPDRLVRHDAEQRRRPGFPFAAFAADEERCWLAAHGIAATHDSHVLADFACGPRAFAPGWRRRLVTHASSSGCASGRSLDDAIARAMLELVERDALMRHWFAQLPGHALRPASLPAWCQARLQCLWQHGCRAGLQWLSFGAHPVLLAWAQHRRRHFSCAGSAAAFDAEVAAAAALDEMETQALARLQGVPAETIAPHEVRGPADHAALHATPRFHRRADALLRPRGPGAVFRKVAQACRSDPSRLYANLRQRGHALHWVDLSLREAGNFLAGAPLFTVRALAQGLVPLAFGLHGQPFGMAPVAPGGRFPHPFN